MHMHASNSELVEQLSEPERTLNRRLRQRNRRVPFERRDERPAQPRIVYLPILDINYFCYFLDILEITTQWMMNPCSSNSDTDKIMARMDAKTMKMDAQYKELQSRSNNSNSDCNDDDTPIKTFPCNALADLCASNNLMPYSSYVKLSLETLKPTKMSTFSIDSAMKHSYSNDDTCFSIDVIDEILEEDFNTLLDEGSEILHSIEGAILKEKIFAEFDEFMATNIEEDTESKIEEIPFKKITFNTDYKIKTSLEEPPLDFELKPLPDHLEYVFLEEPTFLPVIISSQLSEQNKNKLVSILKKHKQAFSWKTTDILGIYKKGTENVFADHLSRIDNDETSDDCDVDDNFPGETLMEITTRDKPWFADFVNYLVDSMIRRCVSGPETRIILDQCHHGPTEGHYGPTTTAKQVLESGFYWPTIIKEVHTPVCLYEACQKTRKICKHDKMPLNNIQVCDVFDNWGIDFMGPILKSYKFEYILVALDYVSKWSEAQALPTNDARVIISFLKKLLCHFVTHRFSTSYHPQTSEQVKNTNRALKRILEKTVKDNPAVWSRKLDDALWAFRTAYKTPTGTTPYKLLYGKNCQLPFEIEHRAYWAMKKCNPDLIAAGEKRMFQLHELDEFRHQAYENSRLYKARTKVWHDRKLKMRKEFKKGNKVLLFHSKYKFKQPKLRSRWLRPYVVKHQYPSRYVEFCSKDGKTFIVNSHRLKLYHEEDNQNDQREEITPFYPKN
ncbi:reverse transcriptase domain-containing protein [Tanacetum coccineum]